VLDGFVPEAIFFDVDGVLIDSMSVKGEAFTDLFRADPQHCDAIRAFHMENGGVTRRDKISQIARQILDISLTREELDELVVEFGKLVADRVIAAPEIPGATLALAHWSRRSSLYAVSATPVDELVGILSIREIQGYFREIQGAPMSKSEAINSIVAAEGFQRRHCVLVGDSRQDLEAASKCSLLFVQVCPHGGPMFPEANAVVPDLRTLDRAIHGLTHSPPGPSFL
jgi:phosphoglycolate phosphatase-like HAD superfamily hydrolase